MVAAGRQVQPVELEKLIGHETLADLDALQHRQLRRVDDGVAEHAVKTEKVHQRALPRLPVLTKQLGAADAVGILTKRSHVAGQAHEPGMHPTRAVGLQVQPAVTRACHAPVVQVLQRVAQPAVEGFSPRLTEQAITQLRPEISQFEKRPVRGFPLRRLLAELAVQTAH